MIATEPIGLYVHIPFCIRKCNYCDFASSSAGEAEYNSYCDYLIKEIKGYARKEKIKLDTVFFGGGTPSVLPPELFKSIVDCIRESFDISALSEFSVEVNPGTVSGEKLSLYKRLGVNRISIGLQSIHENEMKILGRIHNFEDFLEAFRQCRDAGFDNINVDIMYGIPEQTMNSFEKTLRAVSELSPEHISCYGLIIEEGTPFYEWQKSLDIPTEDTESDMYYLAAELLSGDGYYHYEISNYAKQGFECRHNLKYWRDEEYIGVGLAAHSYFESVRYSNPTEMNSYFSAACKGEKALDSSFEKDPFEYAMLRFRLAEGLDLAEYKRVFSHDFTLGREAFIEKLKKEGYMKEECGSLFFTERGFYVSNYILAQLL